MKRIPGIVLVAGGFSIAYHALNTLQGWQHRNKTALGITDYTPYLQLAAGVAILIAGAWLLLRKQA